MTDTIKLKKVIVKGENLWEQVNTVIMEGNFINAIKPTPDPADLQPFVMPPKFKPQNWFNMDNDIKPKAPSTKQKTIVDLSHKLTDMFSYKKLSKYEGLQGKKTMRAPTTYIGVEIELEKCVINYFPESTWKHVEDGSLKVQGAEFVTVPIQSRFLEVELDRLFEGIIADTSSRCSVHVHINIRDLSMDELVKFILLYSIFEKSLFNFSGNRWKNNFCVPMYADNHYVLDMINTILKHGSINPRWFKYAAFNLSPIFGGESSRIGTAEFRHMAGTMDKNKILDWVNLIVSLKIASKAIKYDDLIGHIRTMNTTSGYYWLAEFVFKFCSDLITKQETFKEDIESCISKTKDICLNANIYSEEENYKGKRIMFKFKGVK